MRVPLFVIKYTRYEYWPWLLFYTPVLPYWLWLAIKNKSLAYFTVANPGIELGGFYGESKTEILDLISYKYKAQSILVDNSKPFNDIQNLLKPKGFTFPLIAKPDVGERGNHVTKILNEDALTLYNVKSKGKYIIQEFVDYDIELGVLYSRIPNSEKGEVSSVTLKKFLAVVGDGKSSVRQLMNKNTRARFQLKRISDELGAEINEVLKEGEYKLLEPIGNHCRGTEFIDNNFLINDRLNQIFDTISKPINGFYYGRFDLKVKSIEDLYNGENIKILELNGASSEPGHIYDSKNTLLKAYKDLLSHWKRLAVISKANMQLGLKPVSFIFIIRSYWKFVVLKEK